MERAGKGGEERGGEGEIKGRKARRGGQGRMLLTAEDVCMALSWFSQGSSLVMLICGKDHRAVPGPILFVA